jgi:hypothetical protein
MDRGRTASGRWHACLLPSNIACFAIVVRVSLRLLFLFITLPLHHFNLFFVVVVIVSCVDVAEDRVTVV